MDNNCEEYNKCKEYMDFSNISIFLAYNVNVDAIKYYKDSSEIEQLINGISIEKVIESYEKYPRKIKSPSDFLGRLIHALEHGKPAEVPIKEDEKLNKWFEQIKYDEERIGGQVGIIANLLSLLDLKKVIAYTPTLCEKQAKMFVNKDNLVYPKVVNNKLVLDRPIKLYNENDPLKINRIFEYKEGIKINLGNKEIISPISGRFIVSSRPDKLRLEIKDDLKEKLPELGEQIDCAIFSGYQGIKDKYKDGKTFEYYINKAQDDLKLIRKNNNNLKIHLEFASIQDKEKRKIILDKIVPHINCVGMDEAEIANLLSVLNYEELATKILNDSLVEDVIEGAKIIIEKYNNLEMVQIHTIHYIMVLCKKDVPVNNEQLKTMLELATVMASSKAKLGEITNKENIKEGLTVKPEQTNKEIFKNVLENIKKEKDYNKYNIVIVPSRLVSNPVSTVGLGDTISSTIFVSYVSFLKKLRNRKDKQN